MLLKIFSHSLLQIILGIQSALFFARFSSLLFLLQKPIKITMSPVTSANLFMLSNGTQLVQETTAHFKVKVHSRLSGNDLRFEVSAQG